MEEKQELIQTLNVDFSINLPDGTGMDQLHATLSQYINHLIVHNFTQLVNLLYRLDVNEKKLQQWLLENTAEDAGKIIADLIIERQLQKIRSRKQYKQQDDSIGEDEKW
ncbi:MAG: hypothetical protein JWM28_4227 [Chitinophagaceae bacterium]|nr:hypothetical protein [Chitinophagaceae bacterium]